jgi:hypothetical protein
MATGAQTKIMQKMNSLRIEADENASKAEELKKRVKELEQDNLQKEQEITSLTHRHQLLEGEVEKLEAIVKESKAAADGAAQHGQANEALNRRLQLLEEEAESADKTLRETNEKYMSRLLLSRSLLTVLDSARLMSRPVITSARFRLLSKNATNGRPSMRRWLRSTPTFRRNFRNLSSLWVISEAASCCSFSPIPATSR